MPVGYLGPGYHGNRYFTLENPGIEFSTPKACPLVGVSSTVSRKPISKSRGYPAHLLQVPGIPAGCPVPGWGNGPDSQAGVRVTVYDGYPVGCWYPFANYPGTRE